MKSLIFVAFTFLTFSIFSQEKVNSDVNILGTVTDSFGNPMMGVNVLVKDKARGTQTGEDGHYFIKVKPEDVLVFSYIGMESQEIRVGDKKNIDVVLEQATENLEQVVVNGQKKVTRKERSRSYASTVITSEQIAQGNYINVIQALQGKVAGLNISPSSGTGGPESSVSFSIRGGTSLKGLQPMFFYDGMPLDPSFLYSINVNDIESIEVIKSAGAGLRYGPSEVKDAQGNIVGASAAGVIDIKSKFYSESLNKTNAASKTVNKYDDELAVSYGNEAPYTKNLKEVSSAKEAYDIYEQQKSEFGHLSSYHLDFYNYFKSRDEKDYGLRVLFNIVETNPEDYELLKVLAYHLEAAGEYKLASNIYTQILKLSPEDIQSYRDLALAFNDIGLEDESAEILNGLIADEGGLNNSIIQFSGIDAILSNDVAQLYGNKTFDVRIVADWNRRDANIDLQVIDPTREICNNINPTTQLGGELVQNLSQGYGPEEFTLKSAKKGNYFIMINYFPDIESDEEKPTFLKLTLFKNYGKPNQTKEIKIIELSESKDNYMIAKLEM
ncbi:TonB-dependent receptor plug domain-containing protein [Flavobacteriaceae bacterium XHP0103]|uniref:TonB-dependent receptor plug domain-containing protein n=1 Tax=Marixanthotalea marina TaxID=2844359 RepID=UPI002989AB0C|nr:TonB-dependent receptor plug domain-containing protein [Marixanthotalea marina]MBU3822783.1 TonB-dependent receptor plug domain-containing protein [Marixanthotalea marina]